MNFSKILILILSALFSINLNQWENLSSDLSPNHLIKIDSKLYGSNQGGFFIYDLDDESFALNNHQNCLEVSSIAADNNSLWGLCENGTIYKNNSSLIVNHLNLDDAHDFIISDQAIYVIYENNNIYGIADFSFDSSSLVYNDYYESFLGSKSSKDFNINSFFLHKFLQTSVNIFKDFLTFK